MSDAPHTELIRKLQNNGTALDLASRQVAEAAWMSPSTGAEYLQKLGLNYLESFKLLSAIASDGGRDQGNKKEGGPSFFFPKRLSRGDYLLRFIFVVIAYALIGAYMNVASMTGRPAGMVPFVFFVLLSLYKLFVCDAARFRDRGKTGYFAFLSIIPGVNLVVQIYLWFAP